MIISSRNEKKKYYSKTIKYSDCSQKIIIYCRRAASRPRIEQFRTKMSYSTKRTFFSKKKKVEISFSFDIPLLNVYSRIRYSDLCVDENKKYEHFAIHGLH